MKSKTNSSQPRDASAVILLNQDSTEVVWARRNPQLAFLGGWHAFPGGKVDAGDAEIPVKNCEDKDLENFIVAAARECFEEVGVLLVRNGEKLTHGQRASLHDDLISGRFSFAEILKSWNLWIDATDFSYAGFWTTPQFSPVRFKTRFFVAVCPPKQQPFAAISELENVEFIQPKDALKFWDKSEVLISPPVLIALKELLATENTEKHRENLTADERGFAQTNQKLKTENQRPITVSQKLLKKSQFCDGKIDFIELNPRIICFPVKTETLPPATHTNCFIVGKKEFVVIDAAARDESEQQKLFKLIDELIERGGICRAIVVSHLHKDHFGGEIILQKPLREKFGLNLPISAHEATAESLRGALEIEKFISDGEIFNLRDERGESFELKALHTPGHARGHLAFYDEEFGFLLSSDNVIGASSVIIAPPEGNMKNYLASLERLKNLPNLRFLCGSHGAAIFDARGKIESYIAHRLERERKILEAINGGAKTVREIVGRVYTDISPELWHLAEKSVAAHLEKLEDEEVVKIQIQFDGK